MVDPFCSEKCCWQYFPTRPSAVTTDAKPKEFLSFFLLFIIYRAFHNFRKKWTRRCRPGPKLQAAAAYLFPARISTWLLETKGASPELSVILTLVLLTLGSTGSCAGAIAGKRRFWYPGSCVRISSFHPSFFLFFFIHHRQPFHVCRSSELGMAANEIFQLQLGSSRVMVMFFYVHFF